MPFYSYQKQFISFAIAIGAVLLVLLYIFFAHHPEGTTYILAEIIAGLLIIILLVSIWLSYKGIKNKVFYDQNKIFDRVTDAFIALNKDWRYIYLNEKAGIMHGRKPGELIGKNIWTEFPDVINEPFYVALHEAMEKQEPKKLQLYYSATDRWFEDLIYPSPDGVSVYYHDITEKKKAEEELERSKEKLQQALSSMAESFYVIDKNYCVTLINKIAQSNLEKAWGFHVTVGTNISDRFPSENNEPIKSSLNKVFAGENVEYELHLSCKDLPPWVLVTYTPVIDENKTIIGACIVTKDITGRKKAEEKIRESENKFRELVDAAPDATVIVNEKGIIQIVNRQTEILLGYQRDELINQPVEILIPESFRNMHNDHREKFHTEIGIKPVRMGKELFALKKDGTKIPVEISLSPFHSDEGTLITASIRDITDRKKAEEQLKQSNNRFELITRTTNDAVWEWNLETGGLWANEMHQYLYGLDPLDPVPTVEMWTERIHPDDRPVILKRQKESLASDTNVFISEYRFNVEEKGYMDIYDRCYIVRNKEGKPVRMMGSMMDITERKKAQQALAESEGRLRTILQTEPECIKLLGPNGELLDMNPAGLAMIEAENLEMVKGKSVLDIVVPQHREAFINLTKDVFNGRPGVLEFEIKGLKGTYSWLETNAVPLRNEEGKIIALLSVTRNITEKKKAEDQVKKEKNLSDSVINSLPGIFYLLDRNGKYIRWNRLKEIITEYTADEMRQRNPPDFFEGTEKDLISNCIEEAFATGKTEFEASLITKSGKKIPYYFTGMSIEYEGKPCLIGMGIDITERKKARIELEQSYAAIRQLTEHLQNIREEERIHIAREIHDELGQQLTVMKMDISWLNKKISCEDNLIKQKLMNLTDMLSDTVKTVRRISSELRPSLLNDLGLAATMEWQLQEFEKRFGIKTKLSAPETEKSLSDAIRTGLFRILQESLTNIVRHADAKTVNVELQHQEDKIVLSIRDDGNGFDKKKIVDKRTLGILGMRERTLMMGGEYEIQSMPGKGTTVIVTIPEQAKNN